MIPSSSISKQGICFISFCSPQSNTKSIIITMSNCKITVVSTTTVVENQYWYVESSDCLIQKLIVKVVLLPEEVGVRVRYPASNLKLCCPISLETPEEKRAGCNSLGNVILLRSSLDI